MACKYAKIENQDQRDLLESLGGKMSYRELDNWVFVMNQNGGCGRLEGIGEEKHILNSSGVNTHLSFDDLLLFCFGGEPEKKYKVGDTYNGGTIVSWGKLVGIQYGNNIRAMIAADKHNLTESDVKKFDRHKN